MIIWLLKQRNRKYLYLAFLIILIDIFVGGQLIAWELQIFHDLISS